MDATADMLNTTETGTVRSWTEEEDYACFDHEFDFSRTKQHREQNDNTADVSGTETASVDSIRTGGTPDELETTKDKDPPSTTTSSSPNNFFGLHNAPRRPRLSLIAAASELGVAFAGSVGVSSLLAEYVARPPPDISGVKFSAEEQAGHHAYLANNLVGGPSESPLVFLVHEHAYTAAPTALTVARDICNRANSTRVTWEKNYPVGDCVEAKCGSVGCRQSEEPLEVQPVRSMCQIIGGSGGDEGVRVLAWVVSIVYTGAFAPLAHHHEFAVLDRLVPGLPLCVAKPSVYPRLMSVYADDSVRVAHTLADVYSRATRTFAKSGDAVRCSLFACERLFGDYWAGMAIDAARAARAAIEIGQHAVAMERTVESLAERYQDTYTDLQTARDEIEAVKATFKDYKTAKAKHQSEATAKTADAGTDTTAPTPAAAVEIVVRTAHAETQTDTPVVSDKELAALRRDVSVANEKANAWKRQRKDANAKLVRSEKTVAGLRAELAELKDDHEIAKSTAMTLGTQMRTLRAEQRSAVVAARLPLLVKLEQLVRVVEKLATRAKEVLTGLPLGGGDAFPSRDTIKTFTNQTLFAFFDYVAASPESFSSNSLLRSLGIDASGMRMVRAIRLAGRSYHPHGFANAAYPLGSFVHSYLVCTSSLAPGTTWSAGQILDYPVSLCQNKHEVAAEATAARDKTLVHSEYMRSRTSVQAAVVCAATADMGSRLGLTPGQSQILSETIIADLASEHPLVSPVEWVNRVEDSVLGAFMASKVPEEDLADPSAKASAHAGSAVETGYKHALRDDVVPVICRSDVDDERSQVDICLVGPNESPAGLTLDVLLNQAMKSDGSADKPEPDPAAARPGGGEPSEDSDESSSARETATDDDDRPHRFAVDEADLADLANIIAGALTCRFIGTGTALTTFQANAESAATKFRGFLERIKREDRLTK
jgi:hypothetical protein